jgi:hypothetical protein
VQERNHDPFLLAEEREEEVAVVDQRIAVAAGDGGGFVQRLRGLYREFIRVDHRDSRSDKVPY